MARFVAESCQPQTANPGGRSYSTDSVVAISYAKKNCGLIPLSSKNYWIYLDSVFQDGLFLRTQYDTLRYSTTWKSLADNLIWWEGTVSVGLPDKLYVNDSAFFEIDDRMFTPGVMDAKKDYALFAGDSIKYLANFEDNAAVGRSVKLKDPVSTPAGLFTDCILFEKYARNYMRDQVFFKPGIGVTRYTREKAPMGTPTIKLQQVSTLISFHFE